MKAESVIFDLPTGKIAAKIWGPKDGQPVLALHGWLDNAATFNNIAPKLPGLRIVAPDLPGHGQSAHRLGKRAYHFIDWVDDVVSIAEAAGLTTYSLLGHSLGGGIAALLAAVRPEILRLAMIESLGPYSSEASETPDRLALYLTERRKLLEKRMPVYPDLEHASRMREKAGDLTFESAKILAERGTKNIEGGVTWSSDPALRLPSPIRLTEAQITEFLRRIKCPTLLIKATSSGTQNPELFKARLGLIPQLEVAEVPGKHHVHLDSPDVVIPPLARFFNLTK